MSNSESSKASTAVRQLARAKVIAFTSLDASAAEFLSLEKARTSEVTTRKIARDCLLTLGRGDRITSSVALGTLARDGWSRDPTAVWSDCARSTIRFRVDDNQSMPLAATLDLEAFLSMRNSQSIIIYGGTAIIAEASFNIEMKRRLLRFDISRSARAADGTIHLAIEVLEATSPHELGLSPDDRMLGVALRGFELA